MRHEKHYMRSCMIPLILILLAASPTHAEETSVMVLEGDVSAAYFDGKFTVFDPIGRVERNRKTAAPGPATPSDKSTPGELPAGAIAQASIGPDGKFRLEIAAEEPRTVYFSILDAVTPDGRRVEPTDKGNNFILEPGDLKLRMNRSNFAVISGGYYNDIVYNPWRLSDEYQAAQEEYSRLVAPGEDESEESRHLRFRHRLEAEKRLEMLASEGLRRVSSSRSDPLIERLAGEWIYTYDPLVGAVFLDMRKRAQDEPLGAEERQNTGGSWGGTAEVWLTKDSQKDLNDSEETLGDENTQVDDVPVKSR